MKPKITISELREKIRDIDVPDAEIAQFLMVDSDFSSAFIPNVRVNFDLVDDEGLEADLAVGLFNGWSKRRRQRKYRRKIEAGWDGLRIVSEGDSWFQYPFLLNDVIDQLFDDYAIFSLGGAGHLLSDMLDQDEVEGAIDEHNPDIFLISGGGNDLLGDGRLRKVVRPFETGRPAEDYLNSAFDQQLAELLGHYRQLFTGLVGRFPSLSIFCHGYDHALPNSGKWLGKPLTALGIQNPTLQAAIVAIIVDRFNQGLLELSNEFRGHVFRVNCIGSVRQDQWDDELHPNNAGFASVAAQFKSAISHIVGTESQRSRQMNQLSPGKEARIEDAKDLDPADFRQLVDGRARSLLGKSIGPTKNEATRRDYERQISHHFEKISGGADFLPVSFLERGAKASRAVCQIRTPNSFGSGFLIATPDFIMTNNHVIESADDARRSVAEFLFEEDSQSITVQLEPDRFFITSVELDFTIIGCDGSNLTAIEPLPLLRNPETVTRNERVNVVQHPRGRMKEVALHDNQVKRVKDKVVWYSTDTEPGSSGSPVFNNSWDLVALHHAGWFEPAGDVTNEGIRMAAIVAHLLARTRTESLSSGALQRLLATIDDSAPQFGFFDIAGVTGDTPLEVEVPEYRGSRNFADIGFWNIEHFNDRVSDARVQKIADTIARMSPDALGLVEVERGAMENLRSALQGLGRAYDFKYLNVRGRQDLAVLYDQNTTEVTLATDILNRHRDAWMATTVSGRTAFPRRPLIARIKTNPRVGTGRSRDRDVEFIMICAHLKAFGDPESKARRRLAANILAEVIEDIRENEQQPVLLGGDFNETLSTDVLDGLTSSPDLFMLTADDARSGAISYVGQRYRSLIDHVVASRDLDLAPISGDDAAIVRLDKSMRDFSDQISDHVPLMVRLVGRKEPLQLASRSAA